MSIESDSAGCAVSGSLAPDNDREQSDWSVIPCHIGDPAFSRRATGLRCRRGFVTRYGTAHWRQYSGRESRHTFSQKLEAPMSCDVSQFSRNASDFLNDEVAAMLLNRHRGMNLI